MMGLKGWSRHISRVLFRLRGGSHSSRPAITSHLTNQGHRRSSLCCTCRRLAPPRRYLAPCSMEPGLSSPLSVSRRTSTSVSQRTSTSVSRRTSTKQRLPSQLRGRIV